MSPLATAIAAITFLVCNPDIAGAQDSTVSPQSAPAGSESFPVTEANNARAIDPVTTTTGAPARAVDASQPMAPAESASIPKNSDWHAPVPLILSYDEAVPIPDGYSVQRQPRSGLIMAGAIVGGIAYGMSLAGAMLDGFGSDTAFLAIPLVGPWLNLALGRGKKDCEVKTLSEYNRVDGSCDTDNSLYIATLGLDGVMQIGGATLVALGYALPKSRLVYRGTEVAFVPVPIGRHGYGIGALGRF